jgi:hypothetical protein
MSTASETGSESQLASIPTSGRKEARAGFHHFVVHQVAKRLSHGYIEQLTAGKTQGNVGQDYSGIWYGK